MLRSSPTARMAGSETQPSCFCTSQRIGITADCCRPSGYFAIHSSAAFMVAPEKAKLAGCSLARRLTDMAQPRGALLPSREKVSAKQTDEGPRGRSSKNADGQWTGAASAGRPPESLRRAPRGPSSDPLRGPPSPSRGEGRSYSAPHGGQSPVDLPEDDVEGPQYGGDVGEHVAAVHPIHGRQMRVARRAHLAAVWLVGPVGDQIDAELALRRLDVGVDLAGRRPEALRVELEVVDHRLHRPLHLGAAGRNDLVVLDHHRPLGLTQQSDALEHELDRLAHLLDAAEVAVVAIPVHP